MSLPMLDTNLFYEQVIEIFKFAWPVLVPYIGISLAVLLITGIVNILRKFNQ
ncbi:hypothetical protein SAMN02745123_03600 [Desulforamulus aeronauticus DSM 10349]|uniref:Uncharacterized protein n=1 Tax=Desulforamulus aeronauticus DSM 10349 TaxID=1121421 RepID=A0A1M6WF98_9FIRM|nr:hypothetical protein SAMN02745123_03600 [Desulforamulus aeronauticus DSM 10349]